MSLLIQTKQENTSKNVITVNLCYQTLSIQSANYVIFDNMPVVSDNRPVESDNMPVESDNLPVDSDNMSVHCSN